MSLKVYSALAFFTSSNRYTILLQWQIIHKGILKAYIKFWVYKSKIFSVQINKQKRCLYKNLHTSSVHVKYPNRNPKKPQLCWFNLTNRQGVVQGDLGTAVFATHLFTGPKPGQNLQSGFRETACIWIWVLISPWDFLISTPNIPTKAMAACLPSRHSSSPALPLACRVWWFLSSASSNFFLLEEL